MDVRLSYLVRFRRLPPENGTLGAVGAASTPAEHDGPLCPLFRVVRRRYEVCADSRRDADPVWMLGGHRGTAADCPRSSASDYPAIESSRVGVGLGRRHWGIWRVC